MRVAQQGAGVAEQAIYAIVALLLAVGAVLLLGEAAYELAMGFDGGFEEAVKTTLDTLLLVFILVELLGAVRATVQERKLLAEPFLVAGIIASIKEIIVVAIDAKESFGAPSGAFEDAVLEIAVLGLLILSLSAATLLMRRKEREPEE